MSLREIIVDAGHPWILQLNWFNPHSHFVAPEPYHDMYDPAEVPINRHPDELKNMHPLHKLLRMERCATPLDNEDYCRELRATYYGMITEVDDQVGRLVEFLSKKIRENPRNPRFHSFI